MSYDADCAAFVDDNYSFLHVAINSRIKDWKDLQDAPEIRADAAAVDAFAKQEASWRKLRDELETLYYRSGGSTS